MTAKEEIKFWQKAKKIIEAGYGKESCKSPDLECANCKAQLMIAWIDNQIIMLKM